MVKQDKAGLDSISTRDTLHKATCCSCVRNMVFGRALGLQSNGVDVGFILVGEGARSIWSLS